MDTSDIQITEAFKDYGFWIEYRASRIVECNVEEPAYVELFIGESKLDGAKQFVFGIGQKSRKISKVQIVAAKSKYFFMVINRDDIVCKYKLWKCNIMCSLPDEVLEMGPRILEMEALVAFWSLFAFRVIDS